MDPISAIAVATTAYSAIKKGFSVGREIESMSKDLGRWMGAIQDVKEVHNKKKGRSFGSVEEESLETFAALKKAQQMEDELRTFVNMNYGPNAWNEVIRLQANIRLKKKKVTEEAEQKKKDLIENMILTGSFIFFIAFISYVIYILITFG